MFVGFAGWTALIFAITVPLEAVIRGPFAAQTWIMAAISVIALLLRASAVRRKKSETEAILVLGMLAALAVPIELMNPQVQVGTRMLMYAMAVGLVFLADWRWALGAWVVTSIYIAAAAGPFTGGMRTWGVSLLSAIGASVSGAILLSMAIVFNRERKEAHERAERRERALETALEQARDAQAEAERASLARSHFLSNMSHEIRTPMSGVLGVSRLLVHESPPGEQRRLAETILSSGQSLLNILDDILDLSKLDAGALQIEPLPTQPARVAEDVLQLMEARAHERGLDLRLALETDIPWVMIDGHRLRQVLSNLVGNAIKFTSEGQVRVRVRYVGGVLSIDVEDDGIGMDAEAQAKLFQPFSQAEAGTARKFGGTGLGLAICKQLCELMGGTIEVTSTLGEGSRFSIQFVVPECAEPASASITGSLERPLRVLVAEDSPVNQLIASRLLKRMGIEATVVDNGADATRQVEASDFDIVLMDVHMPEVDGLEATRRIRSLDGERGQIPIVAFTASVMRSEREDCLRAGMNDVLPKPIDFDQLRRKLREYTPDQ